MWAANAVVGEYPGVTSPGDALDRRPGPTSLVGTLELHDISLV